jgi:hypothetical protein
MDFKVGRIKNFNNNKKKNIRKNPSDHIKSAFYFQLPYYSNDNLKDAESTLLVVFMLSEALFLY